MVYKLYNIAIGKDIFEIPKVNEEQDGLMTSEQYNKTLFFEKTDNIFEDENKNTEDTVQINLTNNNNVTINLI